MKGGPSLLLMREGRTEYIDPRTQPEQLTFWPEEIGAFPLRAPGSQYPWEYHEREQSYKAKCIHPAIAAVMAQEDVQRKSA